MRPFSIASAPPVKEIDRYLKWVGDSLQQIANASKIDRAPNQISAALGDYYTAAEIDAALALIEARNLTAGDGLTGGGTLAADRTFDVGAGLGITVAANAVAMSIGQRTKSLPFVITGGLAVITTGTYVGYRVPFDCTIVKVSLGLNQTGSIVVDIWKRAHASFPPTNSQSITASATPTITTALTYEDATLSGWTTSITAGDWLFYNVDSVTSAKTVSINLEVVVTN